MAKRGEVARGERPRGDSATLTLSPTAATWAWDQQPATVSGDGDVSLDASAEAWSWAFSSSVNARRGDAKRGEVPRGGIVGGHSIDPGAVTLDATAEAWSWDQRPTDATGAGDATVAPSPTEWAWDYPAAAAGYTTWVIDDTAIRVTSVRLTPTNLTLEVRAREAEERQLLDTLDDDAGAVDTRERADGTTVGLDRAGGSNTYTVIPPVRLQPPRVSRQWLVDDVSRNRTSVDTRATSSTVSLVATDTRDRETGYADAADSGKWTFDMAGGTIVTQRVADISQGATTTLTLILTDRQAELFETVAAATAGAVVREVPDGQWFSEDTTPAERQTVEITPPSGATDPAIPQGMYVIEGWESEGDDGGAFRVSVEISTRY